MHLCQDPQRCAKKSAEFRRRAPPLRLGCLSRKTHAASDVLQKAACRKSDYCLTHAGRSVVLGSNLQRPPGASRGLAAAGASRRSLQGLSLPRHGAFRAPPQPWKPPIPVSSAAGGSLPGPEAPAAASDFGGCDAVSLGYCHQVENQCTLYRIGSPGLAVGRAVPPMNGRARRGSIRPFSIGSSHCLTQCGCSGCRTSSVSDHPSNGWEQPKQAGWEFLVEDLGLRV